MKTAAAPPLCRWCVFHWGGQRQQDWKIIAAFGKGEVDLKTNKKPPKLAASVLGGPEAQVARAGRKDAERKFLWISLLRPPCGPSLTI